MTRARTAAPVGQRESLRRRTARRSGTVLRFSRRHGGSLVSWTGAAGLTVCAGMWAFTGATYMLAGSMCAVGLVGGAAIAHHQRNRAVNGPSSTRPSWSERRRMEDAARQGRGVGDWDAGNRTVTVTSHARDGSGVRSYTRAAPGQGTAPAAGPGSGGPPPRSNGDGAGHGVSREPDWGGETGWGKPVQGFPGWVKGETKVDGTPLSERERRNERDYAVWRANPNASGDYWDHQRGRAITEDEMEADRKGRFAWQHRRSTWQRDDGTFEDSWGRPVDDPDVHRDRSRPGDDPDTWT